MCVWYLTKALYRIANNTKLPKNKKVLCLQCHSDFDDPKKHVFSKNYPTTKKEFVFAIPVLCASAHSFSVSMYTYSKATYYNNYLSILLLLKNLYSTNYILWRYRLSWACDTKSECLTDDGVLHFETFCIFVNRGALTILNINIDY